MKINDQLRQIRKDYLKIKPPSDLEKYGWLALRKEIEGQEKHKLAFFPVLARNAVFTILTIILLIGGSIGLVRASQNALPGDTLYPIKRLSDNFVIAISGNKQIRVEKRFQDVVGVAEKKSNPVLLKNTVKEYQKAVSQTQQETEKPREKEKLQDKLKEEEQQLKDVSKRVPSSKDILDKAIEHSERVRDREVKNTEHRGNSKDEIKLRNKSLQ